MKAIQIMQFGASAVMQYSEIDEPEPQPDEIKIQVKAAGVNPIDCKIRQGSHFISKKIANNLPVGLGIDLSGIVVEVGSKTQGFKIGDCVAGTVSDIQKPGSYAEYAIVKPGTIAHKPSSLSFQVAASLPTSGVTAWQATHDQSHISKGQRVLIHGGAGGVGHLAIQLAKRNGGYIITTAREANFEFLKELGADECIDYTKTDFSTQLHDIDTVIDLVGGKTGLDSIKVLKKEGLLVTVPSFSQKEIIEKAASEGIRAKGFIVYDTPETLPKVLDAAAKGHIKVHLEKVYPLNEVQKAHAKIEAGNSKGKIVLKTEI